MIERWRLKIFSRSSVLSSSHTFSSFSSGNNSPSKSWERSAQLVKNVQKKNQYLDQIRDSHDPSMQIKTLEDELRGTMGKALGKQGQKVVKSLVALEEARIQYYKFMLALVSSNEFPTKGFENNGNSGNTQIQNPSSVQDNRPLVIDDDDDDEAGKDNHKFRIQNISYKSLPSSKQTRILQLINAYNRHRKDATQARWELTVHRQAVGFIVNNHKFVQDKFPIPPPLTMPFDFDQLPISNESHLEAKSQIDNNKSIGIEPVSRNFGDQLDWWEKIGRWR